MTMIKVMTATSMPITDKHAVAMDRGVVRPVVMTVTDGKPVGGYCLLALLK